MIKEPLLQIHANSKIFALTGAGISKESGIQTLRDSDVLWNNHKIEDVASLPEGSYRNPTLVYDFYILCAHSPFLKTGIISPLKLIPSTSISFDPIIQSICIMLEFPPFFVISSFERFDLPLKHFE